MARSDRRHACTTDIWDRDPWLLCTPAGTVDLRTGSMRENRREDLITKVTTVGPCGECPLWGRFLGQIFDGDQDLIAFVQRMLGYCLTGVTREHALFFCYGLGGNGKGTLLNTFAGILGDYATTAPKGMFEEAKSERHPTDLAGLRGARAVISQETEQGTRWAETLVKTLTGGDPVAARFMRQDFFEYVPAFKLLISGNHKPQLRDVTEAMRRRLHFIPFNRTIGKAERDTELAEKLKPEWPAILRWAIDGCLEWQRIGLAPPAAVREATSAYFVEQDAVAGFLAENCMTDKPNAVEETGELFSRFTAWCDYKGKTRISTMAFVAKIDEHGFKRGRDRTGRSQFRGIRMAPQPWMYF